MTTQARVRFHDDETLTVADAARIVQRSVRTIRRAYLGGKLIAHRDGNGRGVSIRCGDLRAWQMAEEIAPKATAATREPVGRVDVRKRTTSRAETGNLQLLTAARRTRIRRDRASAAARPTGGQADSRTS